MGVSSLSTTYYFGNCTGTLNGREIIGFWEGDDVVQVEPGADVASMLIGADGSGIVSQSVNNSARITLRVQHRSPIHNQLHRQLLAQQSGNMDGISFTFRDGDSNEGGACDRAWVVQQPGSQHGVNAAVRTWVLGTINYQHRLPRE